MLSVGPQLIRAVTHLDVNGDDVELAGEIMPRNGWRTASNDERRPSGKRGCGVLTEFLPPRHPPLQDCTSRLSRRRLNHDTHLHSCQVLRQCGCVECLAYGLSDVDRCQLRHTGKSCAA